MISIKESGKEINAYNKSLNALKEKIDEAPLAKETFLEHKKFNNEIKLSSVLGHQAGFPSDEGKGLPCQVQDFGVLT
jgi:hypothetical protein